MDAKLVQYLQYEIALVGEPFCPERDACARRVRTGERIDVEVTLADCPIPEPCSDTASGDADVSPNCPAECFEQSRCEGIERYAWLEPATKRTLFRREVLDVSWYDNAGGWAAPQTRIGGASTTPASQNTWQAERAGAYWRWLVLRDDRGGASWKSQRVRVNAQ